VEPRCAVHPERPAAGTCERCGAFACAEDYAAVSGRWLCASCAARPDSNYLEAFRLKYWGKRDAWAWVMGLSAVGHVLSAINAATSGMYLLVPLIVAVGAAQACYFMGWRWARAFIFSPAVEVMLTPLLILPWRAGLGLGTVAVMMGRVIIAPLIPGLLGLGILLSTRNQLFFRVPVSAVQLKKAWNLYCNNAIARTGFLLSLLGLLVPGVGLAAVVLSGIALRRVDPKAFPPIGRKGQAIAGIVLGAVATVGWGAVWGAAWLQRT
jgi:hypothetical protein